MLDIDRDRQRISLGLKQTQEDPWQSVLNEYKEGDVVDGKVTKIVAFGAFVQILPGVEGLVHISELAQHHVESPAEVVRPGDELQGQDPRGRRLPPPPLAERQARGGPGAAGLRARGGSGGRRRRCGRGRGCPSRGAEAVLTRRLTAPRPRTPEAEEPAVEAEATDPRSRRPTPPRPRRPRRRSPPRRARARRTRPPRSPRRPPRSLRPRRRPPRSSPCRGGARGGGASGRRERLAAPLDSLHRAHRWASGRVSRKRSRLPDGWARRRSRPTASRTSCSRSAEVRDAARRALGGGGRAGRRGGPREGRASWSSGDREELAWLESELHPRVGAARRCLARRAWARRSRSRSSRCRSLFEAAMEDAFDETVAVIAGTRCGTGGSASGASPASRAARSGSSTQDEKAAPCRPRDPQRRLDRAARGRAGQGAGGRRQRGRAVSPRTSTRRTSRSRTSVKRGRSRRVRSGDRGRPPGRRRKTAIVAAVVLALGAGLAVINRDRSRICSATRSSR